MEAGRLVGFGGVQSVHVLSSPRSIKSMKIITSSFRKLMSSVISSSAGIFVDCAGCAAFGVVLGI